MPLKPESSKFQKVSNHNHEYCRPMSVSARTHSCANPQSQFANPLCANLPSQCAIRRCANLRLSARVLCAVCTMHPCANPRCAHPRFSARIWSVQCASRPFQSACLGGLTCRGPEPYSIDMDAGLCFVLVAPCRHSLKPRLFSISKVECFSLRSMARSFAIVGSAWTVCVCFVAWRVPTTSSGAGASALAASLYFDGSSPAVCDT